MKSISFGLWNHQVAWPREAKEAPPWALLVDRWTQLDPFSFALCDSIWAWREQGLVPPARLIFASPLASNYMDQDFVQSGSVSPAKFVHTLPNVRASAVAQLLQWQGPMLCLQRDPCTWLAGLENLFLTDSTSCADQQVTWALTARWLDSKSLRVACAATSQNASEPNHFVLSCQDSETFLPASETAVVTDENFWLWADDKVRTSLVWRHGGQEWTCERRGVAPEETQLRRANLTLGAVDWSWHEIHRAVYQGVEKISLTPEQARKVDESHLQFLSWLRTDTPIYGVTTGLGDSCTRLISVEQSEALQSHLINYLLCGTGARFSKKVSRAVLLFRLCSLARGYSAVSRDLIDRLRLHCERDWLPVIPQEGSLGASGDLIPLAYLGQALQGQGSIHDEAGVGKERPMAEVLREENLAPYKLKPKEGLALVNGTSAMTAQAFVNIAEARFLLESLTLSSAWLCLAIRGHTSAFSSLINERSKSFSGQKEVAAAIRQLLQDEGYASVELNQLKTHNGRTSELIQDRYSLRCAPQILGPVFETVAKVQEWCLSEIHSTSDNPVISGEGEMALGGNFYGGYLVHGMDYLKISLAQMADMLDRQLLLIVDEKTNRGLPPNLSDWESLPESERHLHHGLKGLHQAASAITAEILALATPNGLFSRSSESHNQDKVSMGMGAATQCQLMLAKLKTLQAIYWVVLTQALDLRGVQLRGTASLKLYLDLRRLVPRVVRDRPLDTAIHQIQNYIELSIQSHGGLGVLYDKV